MLGQPFSERLFERVLLEPAERGATELFAISGYSSPSMVVRHFQELVKVSSGITLDLQVGMTGKGGIAEASLAGFRSLQSQVIRGRVNCRFNIGVPNHSKLYVWCTEDGPVEAFMGSANYTQTGFGIGGAAGKQAEICVAVNPTMAFDLLIQASGTSLGVDDPRVDGLITVVDWGPDEAHEAFESGAQVSAQGHDSVLLPLVQTTKSPGEVHNPGGGLNWGQRGNRNRNEAYIPIPSGVRKSNFFPEKGVRFQIITDDGDSFIAAVAQQGDKAIETPENNSLIGAYFRRRLKLMPGAMVNTSDLDRFGSNGARFVRLSEDLYRLEFQPGQIYPL